MSERRKPGNYSLQELTSTVDGSRAYRVVDPDIGGSWERAQVVPATDVEWVVSSDDGSDSDDLEFMITPAGLSALIARAGAHCSGCNGACGR